MLNVFHKLTDLFSCDLAIDLGSTNTLIYRKGTGLLVNEPSLIAFQRDRTGGHTAIRIGAGTKELLGRHPADVIIVKPVQYGAVADFAAAREMLITYLERIKQTWCPTPMRVIANVPAKASDEESISCRRAGKYHPGDVSGENSFASGPQSKSSEPEKHEKYPFCSYCGCSVSIKACKS